MSASSWLKRWRTQTQRDERRPRRRGIWARPWFETLEDRIAPAVHTWTGAAGDGLWNTPGNWQGNSPPTTSETAIVLDFNSTGAGTVQDNIAGVLNIDQINLGASGYLLQAANGSSIGLTGAASPSIADTAGGNTFDSSFGIALAGTDTISVAAGTDAIQGPISGSGNLTKSGLGTLSLSNTDTYSGTAIDFGTLLVTATGSLPAAGNVTVYPRGTLAGDGSVGNITAIGGTVNPSGAPSILTAASADFSLGGNLLIGIHGNGYVAGNNYGQLNLGSGGLTLSNTSTLTIDATGLIGVGTAIGAVAFGSESGPAPTAAIVNNPAGFQVTSSVGASSLNFSMTLPPGISWIGGSGDFNDATHWVGGVVPGAGQDAVINVAGTTVTISSNDHDTIHSLTANDPVVLSGGTLTVAGTLQEQNSNTFILQGGTLTGATVVGSTLTGTSTSSTLTGITLQNSTLDLQTNTSTETVSGALLLNNSTIHLGNSTGSTYGRLFFSDNSAQLLDGADATHTGTIVFGPNGNNLIYDNGGNTSFLTLGANLIVQGLDGSIETSNSNGMDLKAAVTVDPTLFAGQSSGTITITGSNWKNDGTLTGKNGGSLSLTGNNWTNNGTVTVQNGGNLTLNGGSTATALGWTNTGAISISGGGILTLETSGTAMTADNSGWSNTGTISATGATTTVNLGGSFTMAALGNFSRVNGPTDDIVNLTGTLNNTGLTQTFNSTIGSWNLDNGTLNGGTLNAAAGYALVSEGGTLIGVTIDGSAGNASPLDMQTNTSSVTVSGALLLSNSTIHLGNSTGSTYGRLFFGDSSPQLLDGADATHTGTIVFGPNGNNLIDDNGGSTAYLTLGANLTVQGLDGLITANSGMDVKAAVTVDPTLFAGQTSGTITFSGSNWKNDATLTGKNGGSLSLTGTNWTNNGTVTVQNGANLTLNGGSSATALGWTNTGAVSFSGGGILTLELVGDGHDRGQQRLEQHRHHHRHRREDHGEPRRRLHHGGTGQLHARGRAHG